MTFLSARKKPPSTNRRRDISMLATTDDRRNVIQAADSAGQGLGFYVGAAMLSFQSLQREDQVTVVLAHGDKDKVRNLSIWNLPVRAEIKNQLDTWSFPLFNRTQVVRAAVLNFTALPAAEQADWIHELYVFIGDPRQFPATPKREDTR